MQVAKGGLNPQGDSAVPASAEGGRVYGDVLSG